MSKTLITTIIPTFRRPKLLKRAIESVLAQSFNNFKICVYDNASEDETEDVVAEYIRQDDRVFYIKNNQNIGALNNMIQGVEAVSTDFYSLLNDDDFILPDFYQNAIREFERYPQAEFVCAKTITVDLINKKIQLRNKDWLPGVYEPSNQIISKMYNSHFTQTGVILRRGMRQLIGPFEKSGNDILYMTMAAASSPFVVLNGYYAVYTLHPQSYSVMGGIRGEDVFYLYEALLSTVDSIMKINLTADKKVHLLTLVTNSYFELLEVKQFNQLKIENYEWNNLADIPLPSRITYSGLVTKLHNLLPKKFHKPMIFFIDLIRRMKNIKSYKKSKENWLLLPEDVNAFFLGFDSDVSKFLSYVHKVDMQGNGIKKRGEKR